MKRSELEEKALLEVIGVDTPLKAQVLVEWIEKTLEVDLEPEEPELPDKLVIIELSREGVLRSRAGFFRFLVPSDGPLAGPKDQERVYQAAVEAYNERRRGDKLEAEHGAKLDEGLARLAAEEQQRVRDLYEQVGRLSMKLGNAQRAADEADARADRWHEVVERAFDEVRRPGASFESILAILKERV